MTKQRSRSHIQDLNLCAPINVDGELVESQTPWCAARIVLSLSLALPLSLTLALCPHCFRSNAAMVMVARHNCAADGQGASSAWAATWSTRSPTRHGHARKRTAAKRPATQVYCLLQLTWSLGAETSIASVCGRENFGWATPMK